ncbi:MAG TPA: TIGR03619 family F420-dependent LLM class oxidoreductase [Acidimicrobiia bacterium]|jgi:probable F420-dependent oxidoreductase
MTRPTFGVFYAGAGAWVTAEGATTLAREAEAHGFSALWAIDHAVLPTGFAPRYQEAGGAWAVPDDYPIADPLTWLAFVAAVSPTIRLGTAVMAAPTRSPVVLAKQAATLDVLAGGRLTLGLGGGWLPEEFEAVGVPIGERMARLEEAVDVLRTLWREPVASYAGRFTRFTDVVSSPKPPGGTIPIVLGGRTPAGARRAGRLADGFFPTGRDPEALGELFDIARKAAADAGRDPDALELIAGGARDAKGAEALMNLGVTHIVTSTRATTPAELPAALETYHQKVIAPLG